MSQSRTAADYFIVLEEQYCWFLNLICRFNLSLLWVRLIESVPWQCWKFFIVLRTLHSMLFVEACCVAIYDECAAVYSSQSSCFPPSCSIYRLTGNIFSVNSGWSDTIIARWEVRFGLELWENQTKMFAMLFWHWSSLQNDLYLSWFSVSAVNPVHHLNTILVPRSKPTQRPTADAKLKR